MSFPRYPKYKDSGVEVLGQVPAHWEILRLSSVCNFQSGKAHEQFIDDDGEFICVNSRFVSTEGLSRKFCTENFSPARRDDILMVMSDLPNGRALAKAFFVSDDGPYAVNQRVCILSARNAGAKFLFYLLNRNPAFLQHDDGVSQTHLSNSVFTKLPTVVPPRAEQVGIAAFLDRETAKIDELVAEQQRLIELLKEKRQAVISHAVTKGLNPHAPMKPSGIEWLGDVPKHWKIVKVKRIATIRYGIGEPPKYYEEGTPLIRATNVHAGNLFAAGMAFVNPSEIPEQRIVWLEAGDIVVVRSGAYTGDSAIIPDEFGRCIAGFDMVLRCHSAQPQFVQFALLSKYLKEGQIDLEKMRAAQPHLNAEELGTCALVLPEMYEQKEIVSFLKSRSAEFDVLATEAERAVDLLQERRTALISAAVTGQIDVRQLASKKEAA